MRKKQFKAESQKLLDMMINSIYTHKEIFLRELISNASDAIDKLYFKSLTDDSVNLSRDDFEIRIDIDKDARTITLSDNGIGMTADELESNLGTIAKSGSFNFKRENADNEKADDIEVIGQFGVGFYSAFMVSDSVTVTSRAFGEDSANRWQSNGADGYTVEPCEKDTAGTIIVMHLKEDTDEENYSKYLEQYEIGRIVKKYSDYIRYPIKMNMTTEQLKEGSEDEYETVIEERTLNSMIPIWKKNKSELKDEDYNAFYKEKFFDYNDPALVIHSKTEGQATYNALMFIPQQPPYDYYTKEFEKGLQLYSNGVLIMDKCADLLPDYYSFVRGLVDSADLSLNISREMLQHDGQLKIIAKTISKKIHSELLKMLKNDREKYEKFFDKFGIQLKFGIYNEYGTHKDELKDLIMFKSSREQKYVTLAEYVERMQEGQDKIYYACGETVVKIDMLPQVEAVKDKGYEVLYLSENVDEFALKTLQEFEGKQFTNVCTDELDLGTDEEKEQLKQTNEAAKDLLDFMKESIGDVSAVRFTNKLKNHPVALASEGKISLEMEKVLNSMPNANGAIKAQTVLEINEAHPIAEKLRKLYESDKDSVANYAKILYANARLCSGMSIDNPSQLCDLVCGLM